MKQNVFIDTDVIFDVLSSRQEHFIESSKILKLCEDTTINGFTSSIVIVNCNYLMEKFKIDDRVRKIKVLNTLLHVLPCTSADIKSAVDSSFKDFEDAVQDSIANRSKKCKTIITRNSKDYAESKLEVLTPAQFLNKYKFKSAT